MYSHHLAAWEAFIDGAYTPVTTPDFNVHLAPSSPASVLPDRDALSVFFSHVAESGGAETLALCMRVARDWADPFASEVIATHSLSLILVSSLPLEQKIELDFVC